MTDRRAPVAVRLPVDVPPPVSGRGLDAAEKGWSAFDLSSNLEPWLRDLTPAVERAVSEVVGVPYRLRDNTIASARVNILNSVGASIDAHSEGFDPSDYTAVLFVNSLPEGVGGELVVDLEGDGKYEYRPVAGRLVIFRSDLVHYVRPLTRDVVRVSAGFLLYRAGVPASPSTNEGSPVGEQTESPSQNPTQAQPEPSPEPAPPGAERVEGDQVQGDKTVVNPPEQGRRPAEQGRPAARPDPGEHREQTVQGG